MDLLKSAFAATLITFFLGSSPLDDGYRGKTGG